MLDMHEVAGSSPAGRIFRSPLCRDLRQPASGGCSTSRPPDYHFLEEVLHATPFDPPRLAQPVRDDARNGRCPRNSVFHTDRPFVHRLTGPLKMAYLSESRASSASRDDGFRDLNLPLLSPMALRWQPESAQHPGWPDLRTQATSRSGWPAGARPTPLVWVMRTDR